MRLSLTAILILINVSLAFPQVILTIEGEVIVDTETGLSGGYNIPRSQNTTLTFRNNSLTAVNSAGYILQAGDETPGLNNNHLDGALITGNMFTWNGTDETSWTHALFTGYNVDVVIKYNYLKDTPNGIQRKSDGMTDISGVVAYNIINNPKVGIVVKGMNGVRIYNNTLYCDKTTLQTGRGLIDIHTNTDNGLNAPSTGAKVFNNIFYTKFDTYTINVMDPESLVGFASDYNLFYCETGSPKFNAGGSTKTFEEWQALGYDVHSVVVYPDFKDFIDFVPNSRLDYGTDLGSEFSEGLAVDAVWGNVSPHTVVQNGIWQVGARIYEEEVNDTVELPENAIEIFPNPASEFITIIMTHLDGRYETVTIYNQLGKVVLKASLVYGFNRVTIPEYITSGLYNISLGRGSEINYTKKIMILN